MNMGQAIVSVLRNYSNGEGRAMRSEFWGWSVFNFLVGLGVSVVRAILGVHSMGGLAMQIAGVVFHLAVLVPSVCVAIRRLHDTGRSGWWLLLDLTIIGVIPLIVWYCMPGQVGTNKYGPNPLEPAAGALA